MINNQKLYIKSSECSQSDQQPRLPNSLGIEEVSQGKPWHIPNHPSRKYGVSNAKSNKYLNHQWNRLTTLVRVGKIDKAFLAFSHLARRSISLRVFFLNRVAKGWYHSLSMEELTKLMKEITRILGNSRSDVKIYRFYLPKPDGRKRPIGAPSLAWRVVIAMWADFLYIVVNPRISDSHHGFRPKRGLMTAWEDVWRKYDKIENPVVFELDLEGFFNNINMGKALEILKEYGAPVWWIRWFDWANSNFPLIHKDKIETEKELSVDEFATDPVFGTTKYSPVSKKGAPQGAGWSPLLAVMVLNYVMKLLGIDITWYADDALGICADMKDWNKLIANKALLGEYGIILSEKYKKDGTKATRVVDDNQVKFLGLTWDPVEDMVLIDGVWKDRRKTSAKEIQVAVWHAYEGQGKPWRWETKQESALYDLIRHAHREYFRETGMWLDMYEMNKDGHPDPTYTLLIQEMLWGKQSHTWLSSVLTNAIKDYWETMKMGDKAERHMVNKYKEPLSQRRETRMIPLTTGIDLARNNKPIRKVGKVLLREQKTWEENLGRLIPQIKYIMKETKRHYKAYEKLHGYKYLGSIVEKRLEQGEINLALIPILGGKIPNHSPAFRNKKFWGIEVTPNSNEKKLQHRLLAASALGMSSRLENVKERLAAISQRLASNTERGKDLRARIHEERLRRIEKE